MTQANYALENDATITDRRYGAKTDAFADLLSKMEVGQSFAIPCRPRTITRGGKTKTVSSPERGFNLKAVNRDFAPKVFRKKRVSEGQPIGDTGRREPCDAIRVFRVQ